MEITEAQAERALKKIEGLKKFTVFASETVYYAREVWARDEEEVGEMLNDGLIIFDEPYDGDHFEIDEIREENEE